MKFSALASQFLSRPKVTCKRSERGTLSCELPLCITIALLMVAFPFVNLLFMSARCALATTACSAAARAAASAPSFIEDQQDSLSAVNAAQATARLWLSRFSGIHITDLSTVVQAQPLYSGQGQSEHRQPLFPQEIKTKEFVFQYKVSLKAEIDPLISFNGLIFGNIPGLTKPVPIICVAQRVCEKPEGLVR